MAIGSDFVSRYRQAVTTWIAALDALKALDEQYVALDYGNTLQDSDFTGNDDITKAQLVAAVGSTDALDTFFSQGHATNYYQLRV